jgi:hypothetical protein
MNVQSIKINEIKGIIKSGTALISGVNVEFCYNFKEDKFTAISYDKYKASGIFTEGGRDVPQTYLVGRVISKALNAL